MSSRALWIAVAVAVMATLGLAIVLPHAMLSPGELRAVHRDLPGDCLACHALFRGAPSSRCMGCHVPERIGVFTTTGTPMAGGGPRVSFHAHLVRQDCTACHAEHRGDDAARALQPFSHELIDPAVRELCASCHLKPDDSLHRQIAGACGQCHAPQHWRPAAFDHDTFFVLTGEHAAPCATCHAGRDFTRYTCYGCHEHSPERIRAEHVEEGVRDFAHCVACHRSGEEGETEGEADGEDD